MRQPSRRSIFSTTTAILGLVVAFCGAHLSATAQEFPMKGPIRIIVPVPPGGGTDTLARLTADFLQRRLGQSVVVENRPGASSTIGADAVARAQPDGYTLLFTGLEFNVVPAVRKVPYGFDDFTYLVQGWKIPPLLYASPKYAVSSIQQAVVDMKARPGAIKYGSTGAGAIVHVGMTMFESAVGTKLLHVPYQGIGPVYQALLAGDIDISQGTPPMPTGFTILASVGSKRSPLHPELPTLEVVGIKGATWDQWFGFMAPRNLPKPIADRLIAEITAVLKDPAAIAKFDERGKLAPDVNALTGDAFKHAVIEENKRWKSVVERNKITIE